MIYFILPAYNEEKNIKLLRIKYDDNIKEKMENIWN